MTPEQFKALGLKQGDPIHLTIKGQVKTAEDPAEYRHPVRLVGPSGSIFWAALDDVVEIKIDETAEAPLAVGDRVVHREFTSGESRAILEIRDYDGVPHLLTKSFNNTEAADGVLLFAPVANYVRAKA